MTIYQLSWNAKKYDWEGRMFASMADSNKRVFSQSLAGKCIMKGILLNEFTKREKIIEDEFVKAAGDDRNERHAGKFYCEIEITNWYMGKNQHPMKGNQTTFCQPTNPFWA
jgi:hypothetical protein